MRLKTIAVFFLSAMSLFTVFYWLTDETRREEEFAAQQEELVAYGLEIFAPSEVYVTVIVTDAGFEPAEIAIPINGGVEFHNQTGREVTARVPDGQPALVPLLVGSKATSKVINEGLTTITADGVAGSLAVTAGPEALNPTAANCQRCHGPDGRGGPVGNTGVMAPDLHSRALAEKWKDTGGRVAANGQPPVLSNYVNWVIRFGGVVVSGNTKSLMPAWSTEVDGPLTVQQVDALTALIGTWADEALQQPVEEVPDTVEAGAQVFDDAGCDNCHAADLSGASGPDLRNIGAEPVTDLPVPISRLDELIADYEANPRAMLERWIRDSAQAYNDGTGTGMIPFPESALSESALTALITFLLDQVQ